MPLDVFFDWPRDDDPNDPINYDPWNDPWDIVFGDLSPDDPYGPFGPYGWNFPLPVVSGSFRGKPFDDDNPLVAHPVDPASPVKQSEAVGESNPDLQGALGGAPRWDPLNRQFGGGVLRDILGAGIVNHIQQRGSMGGSPALTPAATPDASTYAGSAGPVRNTPIPSPNPLLTPVKQEGTAGETGNPLKRFPSPSQPLTPVQENGPQGNAPGPRSPLPGDGTGGGGGGGTGDGGGNGDGGNMEDEFDFDDWANFFGDGPGGPVDLPDWQQYFKQAIGTFTDPRTTDLLLDAEGTYAPKYINQRTDNIANAMSGYLPTAQSAIKGVSEADIEADAAARSSGVDFFKGGQYGDVVGGLKQGNQDLYSMLDSQKDQANALGDSAMDLISNAGKLNDRERNNVMQQTLGGLVRSGRDMDDFGLYKTIGNVIEAERLDRNQDLGMAAGLLGAQGNAAALRSSVESPFVHDVFGLNQDPYPGLTIAESSKGLGSDVGPSMFDVGSLYGIATSDRNLAANRAMAQAEADAADRARKLDFGMQVANLFNFPQKAYDWLSDWSKPTP